MALATAGCGDTRSSEQVAEDHSNLTHGPAAMVYDTGWRVDKHVRLARDVNGDHRTDLVGFGPDGVYVALAQGDSFATPTVAVADLDSNHGWDLPGSMRTLADVNGDGHPDLVGIGPNDVRVALATGSGGFSASTTVWSTEYTKAAGWDLTANSPPVMLLGDVDGDGKADLVGINDWGIYVSLSTGTGFKSQQLWLRAFSKTVGGWDASKNVRLLADINNDGLADIVGFGDDGVYVALSDGTRFQQPMNSSNQVVKASSQFGASQGWQVGAHIRTVANLNGDAYPDLIGIGPSGVVVALGTGSGYAAGSGFGAATTWSTEFGDPTGWNATRHVRLIGDVDGDGKDDVVGMNDTAVLLALSTGSSLGTANTVLSDFTIGQGWQVDQHPRMLADVDGDGQLDLVGFLHTIDWAPLLPALPTVPPTWETPACAATRLQPPAPHTCEGPWSYTQVQRCDGVDPSCPQHCTTFQSCAKWENGAVTTAPSGEATTITGPDTRHCSRNCRLNQDNCPITCTGTFTQPTAACQAAAASRAADLRTQVATGSNGQHDGVMDEQSFDSAAAQTQRLIQAQALVSVTPVYDTVPENFVHQDLPGGRFLEFWDERWVCGLSKITAAKVTGPNEACGCAASTLSACEHNCNSVTAFTDPGMERPISPYISNQICMTHDDMPQTTPADIQAKFEALWTTLQGSPAPTVPAATFTRAMVSRLKLIYELFGDKLIDRHNATDEVHRAIGLYVSNPDDNPSCALDIDAPAPPSGCTNPAVTGTHGDLMRCQRLLDPHAATAVASLASADCTALLNGYLGLVPLTGDDAACGGPHLRQVGTQTLFRLEDKQLDVITSAPATLGSLARQLWLFDTWYTTSKAADAAGVFTAPDQLRRNTSFLLGEFWDHVRGNTNADAELAAAANAGTPDAAEAALGLSAAASRGAEQSVISALFTVPPTIQPENVTLHRPPLRSLPLLAMLGDALTPLVADLDGIAVFHDIACQFRDCLAADPDNDTPSRAAWKLLAELEATALAGDVAASTHDLAGWKPTLAALAAQQSAFTQAVADAVPGSGGLAGATTEDQVHPLARPLWLLYKHAQAFHDHFEATGQFEPTAQNLLQGSVLQQEQQQVVTALRGRANALQTTVTTYEAGLVAALQAEIGVMERGAQLQDLTDQRLHKAEEMDQTSHNIEGLRAAGADEDSAFGSLAASFAEVQGALDHGAFVQVGNSATFTLTGRAGLFTGAVDLPSLSVQTVANLAKGQMLVVQTGGAWSPTCSLSEVRFLGVGGDNTVAADLTDAAIGPDGYTITSSGSDFHAEGAGHSNGVETDVGASVTICLTSGLEGQAIGVDAKACVFADEKATSSMSWTGSTGNDRRTTASFAAGLRLSDTPFPDAPVGSLLVVLADPQTGAVRDVRVVHSGGTSILVEDASTAYFIVNDRKCATASDAQSLTVNVRTMTSETAVADQALGSMVDVLSYLRQQQQSLVDQGTLTATQATLLRQQANVMLQAHLGTIGVGSLPAPLASLFDAFVSHAIVSIERQIDIVANQRALDLDLIDLRTIDDEINAGAAQARLQHLVPQWLIRDLDHDSLRHSLVDLLVVSRDYLRPILELWYPHALDGVTFGPEFSALLHADVDSSLITLASQGTRFVNSLLDAYDDGTFGSKPAGTQLPVVVLSFPRPGVHDTNMFWREADAARAQRVWDAINHHTMAHFEVTPEDFYSNNGGDAILSCNEVVPVIKTMEVYVVRPGGDASNSVLNALERTFHGFGGAGQSFIQPAGPQLFELADSVWQNFDLPVRYGETEQAVATFLATPRQTRPVGLSASGAFDVDFSVLDSLPQNGQFNSDDPFPVTEVQLVMELDSRAVGTRPTWVKRCQ